MIRNLLIIFFVSLTLVVIWFRQGYIMGTAEAVLPFYNLERYYHLTEYAWTFHPGLGSFSGTTIAGKPFYSLLSLFQNQGIPGYVLQASTFLFILLSAGIGSYLLIRELFPKLPEKYYLFSVFFYLFNPISLVDVWNRFLLNFMFFYALLPLAVFIFYKGLSQRKYFYVFLLSLILFFYSYAFSALVFVILLWITLGTISLFYFLIAKSLSEKLFIIKYLLSAILFFVVTNLWYLTQLLNYTVSDSFKASVSSFHPQQININTLDSLSSKMGNLSDLYRLNNAWFFREVNLSWPKVYETTPIVIIEFLTTIIVLFGIWKGRKQKGPLLLGFIFFAALFLSKGSNPPFGFLYKMVFEYLPFFQVFRNPIEKFSFVLILAFAPLLSFGIFHLSNSISKKVAAIFSVLILVLWSLPFFTGLIFTSETYPNNNPEIGFKVEVPNYYKDANKFLESYGNNFRVIGFPVADEGITYLWDKGYQGADIPSALFSMPVIFFNTTVPYYYDLVKEIEPALNETGEFNKVANFLNARFFLIREDVDFQKRNLTDPKKIEQKLLEKEKNGEIKNIAQFGKLKIWENLIWKDMTIYGASSLVATGEATLKNFKTLNSDQALTEDKFILNNQGKALPKITYQKINPTFYNVKIENSASPFVLVFSETYSPGWQAVVDGKEIENHLRVNIYGNGWIIDKNGSFDILIKYGPQQWMDTSEKISVIGIVLAISFLVIIKIRNLKKK